jgi:hypothetical protein
MVSLRLALVCALGVLLLLPHAATAGGWWSYVDVNRSHVAPGQRVELDVAVAFRSVAAAEEAQEAGRFYVYLLRGFDYSVVERAMREPSPGNWWSLGDAEAIEVGQVTVSVSDANLGRATAAFTMPEIPAATYHLMLCDAGCTGPLADVIPATDFTVVADPATAQIAQRADRLERRILNQARQLTAARASTDRALVAARNARSEVEQLEATVPSPAEEIRSSPRVAAWAYAGWFVAGVLIAGLAMLLLRRDWSKPSRRVQAGSLPTTRRRRSSAAPSPFRESQSTGVEAGRGRLRCAQPSSSA